MAARRRIVVVTGSRAEYGLLRPVLRAIEAHPALALRLVVTGMHLRRQFGMTVTDIQTDGFRIDAKVPMPPGGQAEALARGVSGIAKVLQRLGGAIVVVLGDRIEALAGALAAALSGRAVAHIHGGDVAPGHLDDAIRHAITKLAHLHLAASADARRRLIRLGERPQTVHVVGAPGLDELRDVPCPPPDWLTRHYGLPADRKAAVILQHPIGRTAAAEQQVMARILEAVDRAGLAGLMIYPNSDPGHEGIIAAIRLRAGRTRRGRWVGRRSVPRAEFLQTLSSAGLLIGNSSAGIIEAPYLGTAVVNVGPRQHRRLRGGPGVVDCAESAVAIRNALRQALASRLAAHRTGPYGNGRSGRRIAAILAGVDASDKLLRKTISY